MLIQKAFKYKLELKPEQEKILFQWLCVSKAVYNLCLEQRLLNYSQFKKNNNYYDQASELPLLKKEFPWIGEVPSQCLQQKLKDLDSAYQRFFKQGSGFPKFHKKSGKMSIRFPDPKQLSISTTSGKRKAFLKLPKLGLVRFVLSQEIQGKIKNCTLSRTPSNEYFASFQVELNLQTVLHPNRDKSIGLDRGVRTFAMTSEGNALEMPLERIKFFESKLKKTQKNLARKKKGSKNLKKTVIKTAKIHEKISNIRKDNLHKASHKLSNSHGQIVIEDLKIRNMTSSASGTKENPGTNVKAKSGLNKSILRQGWHEFERQLSYKLSWKEGRLTKVNPQFTSQTCPSCGHVAKENRKKESFHCVICNHQDHADIVGAKNILARGHRVSVCGEIRTELVIKTSSKKISMKQKPHPAQADRILSL